MNHVLVVQAQTNRLKRVAALPDLHVRVTWTDDISEIKDLGPLLFNHRNFSQVRTDTKLFSTVRVSDDGGRLVWDDGASVTSKSIGKLPRTTMDASEFRTIMADLHLTGESLGRMLGLSRRAVVGYRAGEPIPKSVALAMRFILQRWDA